MKNLLKLAALAGICFAMIIVSACSGGGGGNTVTVSGTYTVTNGITYYQTGTDTSWHVCATCGVTSATSTSTSTN